jgi:hypothetical protein
MTSAFRTGAFALAAAFALLPSPTRAAQTQEAARLLALSQRALGGGALQRVKTLRIDAKVTAAGLSGMGATWQDLAAPRYAETYELFPLAGGDGFDGRQAWSSDGTGLVWVDGGAAGRAAAIAQAYAQSGVLWRPDHGGAVVSSLGVRENGGVRYDVLQVTPPGTTVPFELWLDRRTHLPARMLQTVGPTQSATTFSRYRSIDGLMVPFERDTASTDGNNSNATVVRVTANPPGASRHLRKPASHVTDFSIVGGARQTSVPFQLVDNHVYLSVRLNGKGPYRFIFDTGGANIVDPSVAREIGAVGRGSAQAQGVGAKTESLAFANVDSLQIGDAVVHRQLYAVAPTRAGFGIAAGQPVDGLIGFEVLARFVTTFDYDLGRVIFEMPAEAQPPAGSDVIPFVFDGRQPQFACTIAGVAAQCTLDTGSRASISLMTPFVAAHPSVVPPNVTAVGVNGFGVGGGSSGKLGRIADIAIGRFDVHNAIADISTQTKGAFAEPFVAANVGGGILKRFTMTLDYAKQTMALQQGHGFNAPDSYERAGVFLIAAGGRYVVYDVRAGTPAARAGLLKGDVIDAVDGVSAHDMSLQQVRDALFRPAGTVVRLSVTHKDGTKGTLNVVLADYV